MEGKGVKIMFRSGLGVGYCSAIDDLICILKGDGYLTAVHNRRGSS
jgi:hypothetical protein